MWLVLSRVLSCSCGVREVPCVAHHDNTNHYHRYQCWCILGEHHREEQTCVGDALLVWRLSSAESCTSRVFAQKIESLGREILHNNLLAFETSDDNNDSLVLEQKLQESGRIVFSSVHRIAVLGC